ncbi:MAG: DUF4097 family beta strand repeat protein [Erysipelotrichaceae bacterium]|nr:DUF4097 family beta strand repeat protein [Erysipelotrichaceae bacterium]
MSREQYLYELKKRLSSYPEDFRDEIMDSFLQHFADGEAEGKSDDQIIEDLGSIDEVLSSIDNYQQSESGKTDAFSELAKGLGSIGKAVKSIFSELSSGSNIVFSWDSGKEEYVEADDWYGAESVMFDSSLSDCDVRVKAGDSLSYSFQTNSPENARLIVERKEDRVYFSIERNLKIVPTVSSRLYLQIPQEIRNVYLNGVSGNVSVADLSLGNIVVNSLSGDFEMRDVQGEQCVYKSTSGDLDIRDCRFSQISAEMTSGDVSISECSGDLMIKTTSGDLDISDHAGRIMANSTSGDIEISMDRAYEVSCDTKSGDIELEISGGNFTAEVSTVSGDVDADGIDYVRKSRGHWIIGDGEVNILLRTLSGDVEISD